MFDIIVDNPRDEGNNKSQLFNIINYDIEKSIIDLMINWFYDFLGAR